MYYYIDTTQRDGSYQSTELCLSAGVLLASYVLFNAHYVRLYTEYSCSQ